MTLKKIDAGDLQVGMYVIMPTSWDEHPFLKNKFQLTSRAQIDKMIHFGLTQVLIDTDQSLPAALSSIERMKKYETPQPAESANKPEAPSKEEKNLTMASDKLREAIRDRSLPAPEKSRIVRDNAMTMMNSLLEQPTSKNIRTAKNAISQIVELILTDDEATSYLTKITSHDFYTYTHSVNVGLLAVSMAKLLFRGSNAHNMHELGIGFFLHDLGKVQIDPAIINKPGRLTPDEMNVMRNHPFIGFKLLHDARQLSEESKTIVLQHHERYDGTGYPKQLRGEEIHLYGKICALADVFDALTSDRPYRKKMAPFDALILMKKEMINHFQKDLYEKFVTMLM
jgi:HD-GYP domain-containing protein (c-di-GMP phosphodiesterase class II)